MTFRIAFFPVFFALLFFACTNSEDFLYDESDSMPISVSASFSLERDSSTSTGKTDTISPGDTVAFIAEINPSRSIRMRESFWTLDGNPWAAEFSFRSCIRKPGPHDIAFVLIDNFGDTISDTLHLWVGNPPVLNDTLIIPLPGTQHIQPEKGLTFAWNAYDPDSLYSLHYQFKLMDKDGETVLDTLLDDAHLIYRMPLNPLEKYSWQVRAINEIGMPSAKNIKGYFYTQGVLNESSIFGNIQTSGFGNKDAAEKMDISISFIDSTGKTVAKDVISTHSDKMVPYQKKPLPPGDYKIVAKSIDFSDFKPDTLQVRLRPSEVYNAETLFLNDVIAPTITPISPDTQSVTDTLPFADTLRFVISDNGDRLTLQDLTVSFDGKTISEGLTFENDTLAIPMASFSNSTVFRILTIKVIDLSSNTKKAHFYIEPTIDWFECNGDTMIYKNDILELFIKDTNPYGFEPDSFFYDVFANEPASAFNAVEKSHTFKITSGAFKKSFTTVRSGIRYTNGITKWKKWSVTLIYAERVRNE